MSEETIIKSFLINPTESTFEMIKNKELALAKLNKEDESEGKLSFLISRAAKKLKTLIYMIIERDYNDLFEEVMNTSIVNNETLTEITNYAALYGRNRMIKKLFNIGAREWTEAAKCAKAGDHNDTYTLCINFGA